MLADRTSAKDILWNSQLRSKSSETRAVPRLAARGADILVVVIVVQSDSTDATSKRAKHTRLRRELWALEDLGLLPLSQQQCPSWHRWAMRRADFGHHDWQAIHYDCGVLLVVRSQRHHVGHSVDNSPSLVDLRHPSRPLSFPTPQVI